MKTALAYGYAYDVALLEEDGELVIPQDAKTQALASLQLNLERPGFMWEDTNTRETHRPLQPILGHEIDVDKVEWSTTEILGVTTVQATYRFEYPTTTIREAPE